MRFFAILFGIMLLFGCTTSAPSEETSPAVPNETTEPPAVNDTPEANETPSMTCQEYCEAQPHITCVGEWNISGTYPDCVCEFVCDSVDLNVSEDEALDELEDIVPKSNKTLNQMLDEALAQLRDDFHKTYDGHFEQTTYTWKRSGTVDCIPGEIVLDSAPLTDVKFNGGTIPSIQAAGFIVFDDGVEPVSRGVLIFMNTTPVLPLAGEDFELEYFHSTEHRYMHDCEVEEKELSRNAAGEWVTSSYIGCMSVSAAETD